MSAMTEDGYERHVLAPRRALRERMADRLDDHADTALPTLAIALRHAAQYLREGASVMGWI